MNDRDFNAEIATVVFPETGKIDPDAAAKLPEIAKHRLVMQIVRKRRPVPQALIGHTVDQSWLHSMGYGYKISVDGVLFNGQCMHKIEADAGQFHAFRYGKFKAPKRKAEKIADPHAFIDGISDICDDDHLKAKFHQAAKSVLKQLADDLGLAKDAYQISSIMGGPAVSGEIVLHSDSLYVMISGGRLGFGNILYRSCEGRKDYRGGSNNYCYAADLLQDRTLARFASLAGLVASEREAA